MEPVLEPKWKIWSQETSESTINIGLLTTPISPHSAYYVYQVTPYEL